MKSNTRSGIPLMIIGTTTLYVQLSKPHEKIAILPAICSIVVICWGIYVQTKIDRQKK